MKTRDNKKIVDQFRVFDEGLLGIAEMAINLVAYGLLVVMPLVAIVATIADILSNDWPSVIKYIGIGTASVYLARAIIRLNKQAEKNITSN